MCSVGGSSASDASAFLFWKTVFFTRKSHADSTSKHIKGDSNTMSTIVIVGAQWGDEAKGKLVDALASQADFVVRFSGGNNAGHTVYAHGHEFKFNLIPAGILHSKCVSILGGGMVICPRHLLKEYAETREKHPQMGKLVISSSAHVVFPYHFLLDRLEEQARGAHPIGTTSRGIGPAYQDKVARIGIRMGEFINPDVFPQRLREVLAYKNRLLAMFGEAPLEYESMLQEYCGFANQLKPFVQDTEPIIQDAVEDGQNVMFEGAQGTYLDLDAGTYPYVTSSHPIAAGACIGTGIGPRMIDQVWGVCKAYTTRVGSGPFPTELNDDTGQWIREKGHEYGTTTGRSRRCGWLDLVALRQSCRINSMTGLVLTRLDVLSGLEKINVATKYCLDDKGLTSIPPDIQSLARVQPVYEEFEGWEKDLQSARSLNDLPSSARRYLEAISDYSKTPIVVVSIGPKREETIYLQSAFAK